MRTRDKVLLALFGAFSLLLAGAPWLLPMGRFIPMIEAGAQQRLAQPVRVGRLQLYLLPVPQLVASDIVVGERAMLRIGRLSLRPSLRHLLLEARRVQDVRADDVVITEQALRAARDWRAPPGGPPAKVETRRVVVRGAQLHLRAFTLRELSADVALERGALREIEVRTADNRLRVRALAEGQGRYRLDIAARDWQMPAGPALRFERLDATAQLTPHGISTREMTGVLYGGSLKGPLNVTWKPEWSVTGALALGRVDVRPLAGLLSRDTVLSGLLSADARFTARARPPRMLLAALEMQSDFKVEDGVLRKVDLHAVARNPLAKDAGKAGVTRFSQLSGRLEVDLDGYHFHDLKVAAGMLSATGEVSVARDQTLSGRLEAAIGGTGELVAMPLKVSGTLQEPSVMPTKTAVAAAVAGSVLLPGIGTAVGIKASQLTERLFGSTRRRSGAAAPAQGSRPALR